MSFGDQLEGSFLPNAPFEIRRTICHTIDHARDKAETRLFGEMLGFIAPMQELKIIEPTAIEAPGPVSCKSETCDNQIRPRGKPAEPDDGFVGKGSRGYCKPCYTNIRQLERKLAT